MHPTLKSTLIGDVDVLREVCPEIKRCLVDACKACGEGVQIAFLCPCKILGYKHLAILTEKYLKHNKVVCSKDVLKAFHLSKAWCQCRALVTGKQTSW